MDWAIIGTIASIVSGLFALVALWLYLQPVAHITVGTHGYVLGTGDRQWYVTFRNVGNVAVRTVRFAQEFWTPPRAYVDLRQHFEGKIVERGDEITALLTEQDMKAVEWLEVRYRARVRILPWMRTTRRRFDAKDFAVTYVENLGG